MTRLVVLAILGAHLSSQLSCANRAPAPPAAPTVSAAPPAPPTIITTRDGHTYAIVHFEFAVEEASNAGGEHDTFWFDDPAGGAPLHAHAGGHMMSLGFGSSCWAEQFLDREPDPRCARPQPERHFIAELTLGPVAIHDGGWGLGQLPKYDAAIVSLLQMPDDATARARLAEIARTGMPAHARMAGERARASQLLEIYRN